MTVTVTDNFGFIGVYNATPSTNDWACTYWNWIAVDAILYGLVSHTHDGAAALQNPAGTLSLSAAETGGYLPANTTYYIGITYIDDLLRETAVSTIANITTGEGISTPNTPTINDDATPTDIQECPGGLTGGDYWYKISYVKDGGETLPSAPVYVQIPTDTTYECTIHFESLNEAANGADAIYVYRKIGNTGSYVKLVEITAGSTDSYTDDNTGVPTCDKSPLIVSTITSFNTITIDWSSLDFTDAAYVKVYATTTEGTWPTNGLVATVTMNQATPVSSYLWNGTARTAGKPPEVTQCFNNPPKITLDSEVQGNLPIASLPSSFTWGAPVATSSALPTGITGEARVVLDEDAIYIWDADAATPTWNALSGEGAEVWAYPDYPGFDERTPGMLFVREYPENTFKLYVVYDNVNNYDRVVMLGGLAGDSGYEGDAYEIANLDYEPDYGHGTIAFVSENKSFYYWDEDIATPAWVRENARRSTTQATPTLAAGATPPSTVNFTITGMDAGLVVRVYMTITTAGTENYNLYIYTDSGRTDLAYQATGIATATYDDRIPWEWFGGTTMYCTLYNNDTEDITASTIDITYRM